MTMTAVQVHPAAKKDDFEALTFIFGIKDIKLSLETYETLKRNCRTNEELTGVHLRWNMVPGVQNVKISLTEGVT